MMFVPFIPMEVNNFFLVPQIIADEKYFDVSVPEILRAVSSPSGKFDRTEEHDTKDEYDVDYHVVIRLNINCQNKDCTGWTISLKMHNTRIDGLDWEPEFTAHDGTKAHGWHRHRWNQRQQSAEATKIPVADLDTVDSREQFVIRCLSIMKIRFNARDYGDQLSIAQS